MILLIFSVAALLCALVPAILFCVNLPLYRRPSSSKNMSMPPVSILIPARNEAHGIVAAVRSALASTEADIEVIVMDDASTDNTAALVKALATEDDRVRLEHASLLPDGWNGKQHACWQLAQAAKYGVLCFVDADVRLKPEAVSRMVRLLLRGRSNMGHTSLISGFPRQLTGTPLEWMLLPLIHFVLLGFLPLSRMRSTTNPAMAAGCGQFMMVRSEDYFACDGHRGIRSTRHDGLLLPRLFRLNGMRTDLADLTNLASCRMYHSASEVWQGLAKNATEGLGAPARIVPISLILTLGQVLPFVLLAFVNRSIPMLHERRQILIDLCVLTAVLAAWLPRILSAIRFKQNWLGVLLHPLDVLFLLAIQWYALIRKMTGGSIRWKDRAYSGE